MNNEDKTNMKIYFGVLGFLVLFFAVIAYKLHTTQPKAKTTYAQKFEYKDTKRIAELKNEVETLRVKALRLQAALDSCKYNVSAFKTMTPSVRIVTSKKTSKALDDCTKELMGTKAKLGEYIGAKAQMEVEKDLEINKLKRQMDTCAYFVQEMDKALNNASKQVTDLTNERDSLKNVLGTAIGITKEFPCLKTKRGTVVMASVIPATGEKDFTISNFNLPKDKYKAAKKSCKQTTR